MTSTPGLEPTTPTTVPPAGVKLSKGRRAALGAAGFLACALPTVFTVNITRMLLTGEYASHRFHQATGQGLILFALWLIPIIALLRAGWRGHRPSTAVGWQHLTFAATGVVCAAIAPGGGAPFLVGIVVITGALLWLALPQRPRLWASLQVDPVLAPVALLGSAVLLPYVVDQLAAQNAVTGGHHAQNPHLFDQGWMSVCLVLLAALGALFPVARHLVGWLAGCSLALGAASLAFGESTAWSIVVLGVGAVAASALVLSRRTALSRQAP
jgi:hypothetical protein